MDKDELVFVVGIFIKNPLIAFIVGAIVIGIEIMLLEVIAKGLDKFSVMKSCGDHIRTAMSRILEIALLDIGATVAEYFVVEMPENSESFLELIK